MRNLSIIFLILFIGNQVSGSQEKFEEFNFREQLEHFYTDLFLVHFDHNEDIVEFREKYVQVLSDYYQQVMDIFAMDLDYALIEVDDFNSQFQELTANQTDPEIIDCFQEIEEEFKVAKMYVFGTIRRCARNANETMAKLVRYNFYSFISRVQLEQSRDPLEIVNTIVRSNIFTGARDIIEMLRTSLESSKENWENVILKQVGWETNRFLIEVQLFLEDHKTCMGYDVVDFMQKVAEFFEEMDMCLPTTTTTLSAD